MERRPASGDRTNPASAVIKWYNIYVYVRARACICTRTYVYRMFHYRWDEFNADRKWKKFVQTYDLFDQAIFIFASDRFLRVYFYGRWAKWPSCMLTRACRCLIILSKIPRFPSGTFVLSCSALIMIRLTWRPETASKYILRVPLVH